MERFEGKATFDHPAKKKHPGISANMHDFNISLYSRASSLNPGWDFAFSTPSQELVPFPVLTVRWPETTSPELRLALGITIFSKSTAHGHFLEDAHQTHSAFPYPWGIWHLYVLCIP